MDYTPDEGCRMNHSWNILLTTIGMKTCLPFEQLENMLYNCCLKISENAIFKKIAFQTIFAVLNYLFILVLLLKNYNNLWQNYCYLHIIFLPS